jgi:hypothetical protein
MPVVEQLDLFAYLRDSVSMEPEGKWQAASLLFSSDAACEAKARGSRNPPDGHSPEVEPPGEQGMTCLGGCPLAARFANRFLQLRHENADLMDEVTAIMALSYSNPHTTAPVR